MLANQITPIDIHISLKLQEIRIKSNLSQDKLAELVGVSCQQIHKYESAKNRISASRLFEFSQIMEVPISEFFNGIKDDIYYNYSFVDNKNLAKNLSKNEKLERNLLNFFRQIECEVIKKNILNLVSSITKNKVKKVKHQYS